MSPLLDHNGQPIDMSTVRSALAQQASEPQTAQVAQIWQEFEAHPARGLTPARLRTLLINGERGDLAAQVDLADDMEETDPHLFAELDKRRGAVALLEWSVEAPDDASADEKAIAEQVEEWLEELNMNNVLLDALDALLKGYSCHELVWGENQGLMLPRLTHRPARWFSVDGTRNRLLLRNPAGNPMVANAGHFVDPAMLPTPAVQGEPLKPLAWWVHRHRTRSGYLSRNGLARVLAWPYLYKSYGQGDLAEFLHICGIPLRVGKYPTGASEAEKAALLRAVTSLGHNAAGIMPMGMALEFVEAATGTADPFMAMLHYCDAAISKAILGQTLSASEGQHGTQALGQVHEGVREDIRDSDVRQLEESVSAGLIRPMVLVNKPGADPRRLPRLKIDTGDAEDMALFAENLPKLASAGLRIKVSWAHDKLRIPEASDGEAILGGAPAVKPGPAGDKTVAVPANPPADPGNALLPGGVPKGQPMTADLAGAMLAALAAQHAKAGPDAVDLAAADVVGDWQPLMSPLLDNFLTELGKAVDKGETLQAFAARLPGLVAGMDAGALGLGLAQRAFMARLAGEAGLDLSGNA